MPLSESKTQSTVSVCIPKQAVNVKLITAKLNGVLTQEDFDTMKAARQSYSG
jgi:hypothetical protein